tara:strand:+ start:88 stop:546 length:459 start_codon:yes stop_codon:yes gene_type:complete
MTKPTHASLQAKVFDFAILELVLRHRNSFHPLWTVDSWVKFLIWISLNCGLSGERESLELFAASLGAPLTSRMRRLFFERVLEEFSMKFIADPAESAIFVLATSQESVLDKSMIAKALVHIQLNERVLMEEQYWNFQESLVSIPWQSVGSSK